MKIILLSFIGIAINIWKDIGGGGGPFPDDQLLKDRASSPILDRAGADIFTRI